MGRITNSSDVSIRKGNVYHSGHKVGKWWGRTLYYLNPKTDQLHYRTFSPLGIFLHLFGYKKKYNQNDLKTFLAAKNTSVTPKSGTELDYTLGNWDGSLNITTMGGNVIRIPSFAEAAALNDFKNKVQQSNLNNPEAEMILCLHEPKLRDGLISAIQALSKAGVSDVTVPILTYLTIKMFSSKAEVSICIYDWYHSFDTREDRHLPTTLILTCSSFDEVEKVSSYGPHDYENDNYYHHAYSQTFRVLQLINLANMQKAPSPYSKIFYPVRHLGGIDHAGLIVLELKEGQAYISEIDPLGKGGYISTKNAMIEGIKEALRQNDPNIEIHKTAHNRVIQENNGACGVHLLANMRELLDVPSVYDYISQNQLTPRKFKVVKNLLDELKTLAMEDLEDISKFMSDLP